MEAHNGWTHVSVSKYKGSPTPNPPGWIRPPNNQEVCIRISEVRSSLLDPDTYLWCGSGRCHGDIVLTASIWPTHGHTIFTLLEVGVAL